MKQKKKNLRKKVERKLTQQNNYVIIEIGANMDIKCECGKLLARYEDGKIFLYCKRCKKEVEIEIKNLEPKSQD